MTAFLRRDQTMNEIWNTFTADPTTGVTLVSLEGEIVFINEQSVRIFFDEARDTKAIIGKSMHELGFPDEWVEERLGLFRKMHETGESVLLRTVWHGRQQFSWMSIIQADETNDQERVLVITRRVPSGEEANYFLDGEHEVFNSDLIRLGELKSLTPRELEVLSLIGQGMSIKEVAASLFRSVKTIENHRESIGRKLKKTRGVELACIAHIAGLQIEDSTRKRVDES